MWELRASRYSTPHDDGEQEILIAQFTTQKLAEKYLRDSTLKRPTIARPYKRASLLSTYNVAWVEREEEEIILIDPTI